MNAAIVIPAFNRLPSLETALRSCKAQRTREGLEIIVVDDKSPHGREIQKLCSTYTARYILNDTQNVRERQPALCRNLGYQSSSADVVIFLDADIVIPPEAIETHIAYHQIPKVVVDGQIWSLKGGQNSVDGLMQFSEERLVKLSEHIPHADVPWSCIDKIGFSDNWWAFLSAHCSFKRKDLDEIGGWDSSYSGWGVEDNELGYRAHKRGFSFVYAQDLKGFHIDHPITHDEYIEKCASALRNLRLFCSTFPATGQDPRVKARIEELELIVEGGAAATTRQKTAGGGIITD